MKFLNIRPVIKTVCTGKIDPDCPNHKNEIDLGEDAIFCKECQGQDLEKIKTWNPTAISIYIIASLVIILGILALVKKTSNIPPRTTTTTPTPIKIESPSPVQSLDIPDDGETLITGNQDGKIRLWNLTTGQVQYTLEGHDQTITTLAVSGDGIILASASEDKTIKIWNLQTRKVLHTFTGDNILIKSLAISSDRQTLVGGGEGTTIFLWDISQGKLQETLEVDKGVESITISNDAQVIISGNFGGKINIWQEKNNNDKYEKRSFDSGDKWEANSVSISSDGQKFVSSSCKDKIRVWNPETWEGQPLQSNSAIDICLVALSGDGNIVAGLSSNKMIKLWNVNTGQELDSFSQPEEDKNQNQIRAITLSADGKTLASSYDKTIQVWRLPTY